MASIFSDKLEYHYQHSLHHDILQSTYLKLFSGCFIYPCLSGAFSSLEIVPLPSLENLDIFYPTSSNTSSVRLLSLLQTSLVDPPLCFLSSISSPLLYHIRKCSQHAHLTSVQLDGERFCVSFFEVQLIYIGVRCTTQFILHLCSI